MTSADRQNNDARLRLVGLTENAARWVAEAGAALQRQQAAPAEKALRTALTEVPEHAEVLRLLAMALRLQGRNVEALALLQRAAAKRPQDALIQNGLGSALDASGDGDAAVAAFRRACELAPGVAQLWANLGKTLGDRGRFEEAVPVLEHALQLADHHTTHLRLAYAQRVLGHTDAAARSYRQLVEKNPADGAAWLGLSSLKKQPFSVSDIDLMQGALQRSDTGDDDRISLGFALAHALDEHSRYPEALDVLTQANARTRRVRPWGAREFSAHVDAVLAAFARPPQAAPKARGEAQGSEVIFIVSMPRAGSSLTEQILASHPRIEGAGEIDDLVVVIAAESQRRGVAFPQWVASATPQDWQRLGREYLRRTARWQKPGMIFTDKLPGNWLRVGAATAMLPGARFIDCRRDSVETCFSCFRQLFSEGTQAFSYDLGDIASYWHDYDRSSRHWQTRCPDRLRVQSYEALQASPEQQIAELLEFCGLEFDPACGRFYENRRSVRTASASQVREPIMRDTAHAVRYGGLLDPLRAALQPRTRSES